LILVLGFERGDDRGAFDLDEVARAVRRAS
jgi:hypothetical protein